MCLSCLTICGDDRTRPNSLSCLGPPLWSVTETGSESMTCMQSMRSNVGQLAGRSKSLSCVPRPPRTRRRDRNQASLSGSVQSKDPIYKPLYIRYVVLFVPRVDLSRSGLEYLSLVSNRCCNSSFPIGEPFRARFSGGSKLSDLKCFIGALSGRSVHQTLISLPRCFLFRSP